MKNDLTNKATTIVLIFHPVEEKHLEAEYCNESHIPFHESSHLIGLNISQGYGLDIIFKTETTITNSVDSGVIQHKLIDYKSGYNGGVAWNEHSGTIDDISYVFQLKVTLEVVEGELIYNDEFVLKSDI